jgi:O-antigen/teichoic acid export membrane protein
LTDKADNLPASRGTASEQHILTAAKGGGILTAGRMFAYGARFIVAFMLARLLGAEEYGLYVLALSAATMAGAIGMFGLDSAVVRYVAVSSGKRDDAGLWGTLQVGVGGGVLISALAGLGLIALAQPIAEQVFHEPELVPLLRLLGLTIPIFTLSDLLVAANHGLKKMLHSVIAEDVAQPLIRICLIGLLALGDLDAFQAIIAFVIADLAASVILLRLLNREFSLKRPLKAARRDVREIAGFSLPVWISQLLKKFRGNIQSLFLGAFSTVTSVGVFTVASKITVFGRMSSLSFMDSAKPIVAQLHAQGEREQMGHVYQTTSRWIFVLNLPVILTIMLLPGPILSIFGESFVAGATALVILACANLVNVGTGIGGTIIDMTGHTRLKLVNSVLQIILVIGTNLLLIPRWGVLGAAVASLISLSTIQVLRQLEVWILFRLLPYNRSFVKPVAAGLATLVIALAIRQWVPTDASLLHTVLHVIIVFAAYAGITLLLGFPAEDRAVLAQMYRRASSLFSQSRAVLASYWGARSD